MLSRVFPAAPAVMAGCVFATPVSAEIPEPVRAMIEAAIESGDSKAIATVFKLAKQTNPDDLEELAAMEAEYKSELRALAKAQEAAEEEQIRNAGLFQNWSGKGELGGFRSTGNADNLGVTAGLKLSRQGINWRHKLSGRADYQESNGQVTREQFFLAYEPNLTISDRLFVYALAQYERDRFQGFSSRYSVSGGLGYDVIVEDDIKLSVKAGPAWRRTEFVGGGSQSSLAALAALDFDWKIADSISLTQDANAVSLNQSAVAFIQAGSSTFTSDTGLVAKIADDFSIRVSYTIEHDTNPPAGSVKTDTLSRLTLIYDF